MATAQPKEQRFYATGKRKASIARLYLVPGEGKVIINKRPEEEYFGRESLRMIIRQPLEITDTLGKYDIYVNATGGGLSGQAGAIRHGISKALTLINETDFYPALKKAGFLTRDSRIKERKKYGQPKARKRYQYSKR